MCNHNTTNPQGFTLLEFLVVVAIMGITLAIGFPTFQSIINSSRLTNSANDMVTALNYARSEAIKQTKKIGLNINMGESTWIVYDPKTSQTIQSYAAAKNVKIDVEGSTNALVPYYTPDGRLEDNLPIAITFSINGTTDQRTVHVQLSGKINVTNP